MNILQTSDEELRRLGDPSGADARVKRGRCRLCVEGVPRSGPYTKHLVGESVRFWMHRSVFGIESKCKSRLP